MKSLKKRITVKNDGFCNCKTEATYRILKAALRYINKMPGWFPTFYSEGNSFSKYECYVHMIKPKNEVEQKEAIEKTIEQGWQFEKGVCVGHDHKNGYYK